MNSFFYTSYVKLQQAYFSESNTYGGWTLIGYTAPGTNGETTNFWFSSEGLAANTATAAAVPKAWTADNKAKLNDCALSSKAAGVWKVSLDAVANGKDTYSASVTGDGCLALTPTFNTIGK